MHSRTPAPVTSPARVVIQAAIGIACAVIGVGAYIVAGLL